MGDLATEKRAVETAQAEAFARDKGLIFMETSAKTGVNVQEIFQAIAQLGAGEEEEPRRFGVHPAGRPRQQLLWPVGSRRYPDKTRRPPGPASDAGFGWPRTH